MARTPKLKDLPPEETPPPEPPKPRYEWPKTEEKRQLFVTLGEKELGDFSRRLAATVPEISNLERDAKASASGWKARIDVKTCEQAQLSQIVSEGREERPVPCEWIFECSGVDSDTKERIYHPEKKALFRTDTWECLEVREITSDERQMSLIEEEPPEQEEPGEEKVTF